MVCEGGFVEVEGEGVFGVAWYVGKLGEGEALVGELASSLREGKRNARKARVDKYWRLEKP